MFFGLQNIGCSCHMNAVIQQLYRLPQLKERVISLNNDTLSSLNISRHLKHVVSTLHSLFGDINTLVTSDCSANNVVSDGDSSVMPPSHSVIFNPTPYYKQYLLHHYLHEKENGNSSVPILDENDAAVNDAILSAILEEEEKNSYHFINEVLRYFNSVENIDDLMKINVTNTITIRDAEVQVPTVFDHHAAATTYNVSDSMYIISLDILAKRNIVEALDDYFTEKSIVNHNHTHGTSYITPFLQQ
jgi:ubiquitin C-terminal hydrolase